MKSRLFDWASQPMCITESAFRSAVARLLSQRIPEASESAPKGLTLEDIYGPPSVREEMIGSVYVLHVEGVIDRFVPEFWQRLGYVDVDRVASLVRAAVDDRKTTAIVLAFNSPGGSVWGTPEAAEVIAEASLAKPIVAHASNLLCSGAYWLASGAGAILADPSAEIGSVGVYTPMFDFRGWYEQCGVAVELAKTGELKGAGYPGTEWTGEQKAHEQEIVEDFYATFRAHVLANREIADDRLTGGVYVAPRALEYGFIDGIGGLADAVALAGDLGKSVKQNGQ